MKENRTLKEQSHLGPMYESANIYQIRLRGEIDQSWSDWFGGMAMMVKEGGDGSPITQLTGYVADQSVLRGILNRIWDLNLDLISVIPVTTDGSSEDDRISGEGVFK